MIMRNMSPSPASDPASARPLSVTASRSGVGQLHAAGALMLLIAGVVVLSGASVWAAPHSGPVFPFLPAVSPGQTSFEASSSALVPDANLLTVIRETIDKPTGTITEADLQGITVLRAENRGIADLTGLEHCTNLTELIIRQNRVADLSPLSGLHSLVRLDFGQGSVDDLSPLANLRNLKILQMDRSGNVTDLSPISGLRNLEVLWAYSLPVTTIEPLANLTNLVTLRVHHSRNVTSLEPLRNLTNLRTLSCHDTACPTVAPDVVWMDPLSGLVNLESLRLDYTSVSTLTPIAGLTKMKDLSITKNPLTTLAPLNRMTELEQLNASGCENLADIDVLSGLSRLSKVNIGATAVRDLGPLASAEQLQWISAGSNHLTDLSPVAALPDIRRLYLSNNQISDLDPLTGLTGLSHLFLDYNQITDISPLVANPGLGGHSQVNVAYNSLDLSPGSSAIQDIQALLDRNVRLTYEPQALFFSSRPSGAPNPVQSGGEVACNATATDTREYEVSYNWVALDAQNRAAGRFDDASASNPTWTAPPNTTESPVDYMIRVTATSEDDASLTGSYTQTVDPLLRLLRAVHVDFTHVELHFTAPVRGAGAETVENYSISGGVPVLEAEPGDDGTTVILTTDTQVENTSYTITVTDLEDRYGVEIAEPHSTASWTAPGIPPRLLSATRAHWTSVTLEFDEEVQRTGAENIGNYVVGPELGIVSAELDDTGNVVSLTTDEQEESTTYSITVINIQDLPGNTIDSDHDTASWTTPGIPPRVVGAAQASWTAIRVSFDEAVDSATAEAVGNYSIEPSLPVSNATLSADGESITLTTGLHADNTIYTIIVQGVEDLRGNVIDPDHNNTSITTGVLPPGVTIGAPTGDEVAIDHPITVTFNKPMNPEATEAAFNISPDTTGIFSWSDEDRVLTFVPEEPLVYGTVYTVRVETAARDVADNGIETEHEWSFTTEPWPLFSYECPGGVWMIAVPARPAIPAAEQVFGTADTVRWDSAIQDYYYFNQDAFDVSPGSGYWVRYPATNDLRVEGHALSMPLSLSVAPGWNLLGNPLAEALPWSAVQADGGVSSFGWVQNDAGTGYELVSAISGLNTRNEIAPWRAFWLHAGEACSVMLGEQTDTSGVDDDPARWAIRLSAAAGHLRDEDNYVGRMKTASALSAPNPPQHPGDFVELYVLEESGEHNAVSLRADGAPTSWNIVVETTLGESAVEVRAPDLSAIPHDHGVMLTDLDTGRRVNMRTTERYRFPSGPSGVRRTLRLEIEPRVPNAAVVNSLTTRGAGDGLAIVYTLSSPAQIEIEVLNLAGRMIATVAGGERDAGLHTSVWTGYSHTGTKVPAGRYLVTVRSMAPDGTTQTHVTTATVGTP